ncbi:MAG: helix-turn-helix transcriptional regulator [Candidatus Aenigmarchaeota archaeon]|nr:helix-turn-helix transcriptional regulator [Candidatus Aenigmarchaeota archaeon]
MDGMSKNQVAPLDPKKEVALDLRRQIPARLRRALSTRDWTAQELARRSGIQAATITGWLRGVYLPRLDQLALVADALKISRGVLAYGE